MGPQGKDDVWTDQWLVYQEITQKMRENSKPLRIFLQASAGTGKSFLLETVYIWSFLKGHAVEACAPTGIAAARLRIPRTPVKAVTLHYLFGLNIKLESSIDLSKPEEQSTKRLRRMSLLIVDEVSMIDDDARGAMKDQLTTVASFPTEPEHAGKRPQADDFGAAHIIFSSLF